MPSLSVVVLTRDEEKHIRDCLASVRDFADDLLVLDSGSRDRTVEIAKEMGARTEYRLFDSYPSQRNASLEFARDDWVFFIDADERATPAVGREIRERIASDVLPMTPGYWIPRRNIIFGKEIRHTGWFPDYQPRVLRKGHARFDPARRVHELVQWDGESGYLNEPLLHYNYETLAQFRSRQSVYTQYEAQIWFNEGKSARWRGAVGQPLREFFRRYVALQGWRDGGHGFLLSALMAYYALVRWQMLKDMGKRQAHSSR